VLQTRGKIKNKDRRDMMSLLGGVNGNRLKCEQDVICSFHSHISMGGKGGGRAQRGRGRWLKGGGWNSARSWKGPQEGEQDIQRPIADHVPMLPGDTVNLGTAGKEVQGGGREKLMDIASRISAQREARSEDYRGCSASHGVELSTRGEGSSKGELSRV